MAKAPKAAAGGIFTILIGLVAAFLYFYPGGGGAGSGGTANREQRAGQSKAGPSAPDSRLADRGSPSLSNPALRFGIATIPAKAPRTIRLTTWNIENLYDNQDDRTNNWPDEPASEKPKAHRDAAGAALRLLDPDVLALEEIESIDALKWFLADQNLADIYPHVASLDAGDGRGIEQAVISKFPLSNIKNWSDRTLAVTHPDLLSDDKPNPDAGKPIRMARSPLAVDVTVPGSFAGTGKPYVLTLMVLHAKANRGYAFQRVAEAERHLEMMTELTKGNPAKNLIVLGDFNARKSDPSVQIYTSQEDGSGGLFDPFADFNPGDPKAQTHVTNRIIDHILLNPAAKPELVPGSRFVYALPLPPASNPFDGPKPEGYVSDHLPVSIDLKPVD